MDDADDYEDSDRTLLSRAAVTMSWEELEGPDLAEPGDTYPDDAPTWPNYGPLAKTREHGEQNEDETTARLKLLIESLRSA